MSNLPFVEEILADLRRFAECVEDGQDVELGRDRFDLLTQLGLLERIQRSPARWMMTQAGEDAIAQPSAGEPIHQWADQDLWMDGDEADMASARAEGFKTRTLWTAPPAAAHGDEAVRKRIRQLEVLLDRCRDHVSQSMELMDDYDDAEEDAGIASELIADIDAAMRAQGDGEAKA